MHLGIILKHPQIIILNEKIHFIFVYYNLKNIGITNLYQDLKRNIVATHIF